MYFIWKEYVWGGHLSTDFPCRRKTNITMEEWKKHGSNNVMCVARGEAWRSFAKTLKTKTATKEQPYKPKTQRKSPSGTCSKKWTKIRVGSCKQELFSFSFTYCRHDICLLYLLIAALIDSCILCVPWYSVTAISCHVQHPYFVCLFWFLSWVTV